MHHTSWVAVATYTAHSSAEAMLVLLKNAGLPAYVSSDEHVPGLGSSFSVLVPRDLLQRAQRIVQPVPLSDTELTYLATGELPGSAEIESL